MNTQQHTMADLFDQLGLPSTEADIQKFIDSNRPLDAETFLSDAPFWNSNQAKFLREQILIDADWAVVVDELNTSLR